MKKRAVFTIARNERFFLPIWVNYYKKFFDKEDIYVLDHDTTDGSTESLDVNVRKLSHETVSHGWMLSMVSQFQQELLQNYEYVLFVEADEIVMTLKGLGNYIDEMTAPAARCIGYDVAQQKHEAKFDPSKSVLSQRGFWYARKAYDKTLLAKVPLNWCVGFHHTSLRVEIDPTLILFHLRRLDYDAAIERFNERRAMLWAEEDLKRGLGYQWRMRKMPFWSKGEPIPDDIRASEMV